MKVNHFALLALCSAVLAACGSGDAPEPPAAADSNAAPPTTAAGAEGSVLESADYVGLEDGNIEFHLHWVAGPVAKDAPAGSEPPNLEAVRTAAGATFDRVMFRFVGTALPSYELAWVAESPESCRGGSAAPEGAKLLRLRILRVADAPSVRPEVEEGMANLKGVAQTCSDNDQLDWLMGVADSAQVRVIEMRSPPRLVVDVRHGPLRVR